MKKIAVVNDISGFGRCSLSASLPIVSALGVQCCPLVTGVFSAQTGYPGFVSEDLTDEMPSVIDHWNKMGMKFDGILTGFISSAEQGRIIISMLDKLKSDNTCLIVDPVMGDEGKVYPCYTEESIKVVKELASRADIITPNISELCILADEDFIDDSISVNEKIRRIIECCRKISKNNQIIITTGINISDTDIGTGIWKDNDLSVIESKKYGGSYSGTGDIFASVIAAEIVKGTGIQNAVMKAGSFISKCAKQTSEIDNYDRNDGVLFENMIGYLIDFTND